jgi:hypothetical protein
MKRKECKIENKDGLKGVGAGIKHNKIGGSWHGCGCLARGVSPMPHLRQSRSGVRVRDKNLTLPPPFAAATVEEQYNKRRGAV